jgi:hypothetical protein
MIDLRIMIRGVPLKIFRYILLQEISDRALDLMGIPTEADIFEQVNFMADDVVLRIKQKMLGTVLEDVHISYPATWWDAVKDQFFPQWMLRRWPAKYKHHDIIVRELYPRLSLPDEYHVLNMDRREWVGD